MFHLTKNWNSNKKNYKINKNKQKNNKKKSNNKLKLLKMPNNRYNHHQINYLMTLIRNNRKI